MALLSNAMRAAAITGSAEPVDDWFAGRQLGFWSAQHRPPSGASRIPPSIAATPPADRAEALSALAELRRRGVIDDAELARLQTRLGASRDATP
jgi:hypothetical protein